MIRKDFDKIQKEVLDFLPKQIIDAHVHTGTKAGDVDVLKQKPHPLSYGIMKNRVLSAPMDVFSRVFPGCSVSMIGFPLPLPFKEIDPVSWNNKLMISEMKKGIIGVLNWIKNIDDMKEAVEIAKVHKLKFFGVKFHPRMFPSKKKKNVLASDMINDSVLDFVEENKFAMILELSHGLCSEDVSLVKEIDSNYKINIILPHMAYNYRGFLTRRDDYIKSLTSGCSEFVSEFSKLKESDRVFMDNSMVIDKRIIEAGLKVFGEDKIIYGTDFPFCFTSKIKEERPSDPVLVNMLKSVIDENPVKDIWKYDYNIYLLIKAIIDAEKSLKLDIREKIMRKNAVKAFGIRKRN